MNNVASIFTSCTALGVRQLSDPREPLLLRLLEVHNDKWGCAINIEVVEWIKMGGVVNTPFRVKSSRFMSLRHGFAPWVRNMRMVTLYFLECSCGAVVREVLGGYVKRG